MSGFTTDALTVSAARATDKGTKIVKPGQDLDKNSFLRILTAELANQDPTNAKDSTQYVAQMAQFASLEQMSNLNSTMTFAGANSLIGKSVSLNSRDALGNPYVGLVKAVSKDGSNVMLSVEVDDAGTVMNFDYSQVLNVNDVLTGSSSSSQKFVESAALVGKNVRVNPVNTSGSQIIGTVNSVIRANDGTKLKVKIDSEEINKEMNISSGKPTSNIIYVDGIYRGDEGKLLMIKYNKASDSYEYKYNTEIQWNKLDENNATRDGVTIHKPDVKPIDDLDWSVKLNPKAEVYDDFNVNGSPYSFNNVIVSGIYTGASDKTLEVRFTKAAGEYEYKYTTDSTWNKITDKKAEVDGLTLTMPSAANNPNIDTKWTTNISKIAVGEIKEVPLENLVEVKY